MGIHQYLVFMLVLAGPALSAIGVEYNMEKLLSCAKELEIATHNKQISSKLENFSNWTREEEEVPCYGRCLVYSAGLYDIQTNKWHKQVIVDLLGADVYNYCRHDLNRAYDNACESAYKGFHCLQEAHININETKSVLLQCVSELGSNNEQLQQYIQFKKTEAIPCLFKCFAEKLHLYTTTFERNSNNWIRAFGPIGRTESIFTACTIDPQQKQQMNVCAWMYEDYVCLERYIYNTEGLYPEPSN